MPDSLFSWDALVTLSGAAMLTFLITLYTTRLIESRWKWGTDLYAVGWAFIILTLANIANGASFRDWRLYALAFFNSFLIAAAAGKLRDKSISEAERRRQEKESQSGATQTG